MLKFKNLREHWQYLDWQQCHSQGVLSTVAHICITFLMRCRGGVLGGVELGDRRTGVPPRGVEIGERKRLP